MTAMVKGAKKGNKQARQPVIAPDSAQSKTYIKILYGLSEGEIEGLANGLQSVFLEETPLVDANGGQSFQNVKVDFRNGSNDQEYIEGFPAVESETAIDVELKSDTPWVRAFNNLDLDAVRLRFKWGPLRVQDSTSGDVNGLTIEYAVDVQTDGGAWSEVLKAKISDKTSANYERAHRIDLPRADKGWLVRVRRLSPNSSSEYISDKMYVAAVTEVIDAKLRYPNTALLGLQYDAETFGNVAKVAADTKGRIIKVPTNYNPLTRQYVGIWDGTFKETYSNNPAWIYYDICTADRYALGDRLTPLMIDKWSLYRLAQYCDQMVPDGLGGQEPRFTCNVYLQGAEDAFSILTKLAGVFRAITFWDGNSIVCDADIPQDTYFTYTRANVIEGVFEYSGTRARDRHNVVKVAWDNPANHYKTEYEFVRDEIAIAEAGQVRILDLDAWGCTSRGQAQRAGQWALKSEQLETRTVSFKVGLDGHIPLPGKVIEVADPLFAGRANGGRVSAISADRKSITLDRDNVVAKAGDRLVINGENGKAQTRVVQSIIGRVVTVTVAFDVNSIAVQNVWVLDAQDLATMKFRVISIAQEEKHQFSITALQYNPSKFDAIDNGAHIDDAPISIVNPTAQDPVTNISITSESRVDQGINISTMIVSWAQARGAVKYLVEWRKDDGSWIKLPLTGNNSIEVSGIYAGQYQARVTAISAFEIASLPTYSVLTPLTGKQGLPPKLAFIRATGTMFGMKVEWGFPATGALDTAYTEIEYATTSNGANSQALGSYAYPTTLLQQQGLAANVTLWYRGRLVDRIGNIGEWSNWVSGTSTAQTNDILDALDGLISETQLNKNLRDTINKIETIEGLDGDIGNLINKVTELEGEVDNANAAIDAETQQRVSDIAGLDDSLTKEIQDRTRADAAEAQARADAIAQESLTRQGEVRQVSDAVAKETKDRIAAIQGVSDGLTQEVKARVDGDQKILNAVTTYKESTDTSIAAVQESIDIVADDLHAAATKLDGVYAKTTPLTADQSNWTADNGSNQAAAWTIQSAFADGDLALSKRIDVVNAEVGSNHAAIQQEALARVNGDSALSQRIDTLSSDFGNNNASIQQKLVALADADGAQVKALDNYIASNDKALSAVIRDVSAVANDTGANTQAIDGLRSSVKVATDNAGKALENSASAISKAETAVSQAGSASSIAQEATATAQSASSKADGAVKTANTASSDAATAKENAATALSKATAAADESSANASSIIEINAALKDKASTGALEEVKADVEDIDGVIKAQTQKLDGVYAKVTPLTADQNNWTADSGSNQAGAWTIQSAYADGDLALSKRIDTVSASVGDNTALIQQEAIARANGDAATVEALNIYKASNDLALAAVSQKIDINTKGNEATASRVDAIDIRVKTTEGQAGQALENSATAVSKSEAAVSQAGSAVTVADQAKATAIAAGSDASTAKINAATALSKASAAADASSAAVERVQSVEAKLSDKASTGYVDSVKATVDEQGDLINANTERLSGVYAKVTPLTADSTSFTADSGSTEAGSWSLQSAAAEGDLALSKRIDITQAQVDDNKATIASESIARVNADSALGQRIDTVQTQFESNKATVQSQIKTLTDNQSSQATRIDTVQASASSANVAAGNAQTTANSAQLAAQAAATAAGNKGEVIFGTTAPASDKRLAQNLWIDTTGGANTPKRWNGSAWVTVTDKAATDAAAAANAAQKTANDALDKANTANTNLATVQQKVNAVADAQNATAEKIDTIQTTVDGHTASIQEVSKSVDGVYAEQFLKFDVNGHVSGHGSMNDGKTSTFIFNYDAIQFGTPTGVDGVTPKPLMTLQNTPVTLPNGTVIPRGLYVDTGNFGYINANRIWAENLSVISADLGAIKVKNANIEDGAIDTLKIKDEAVTVPIGVKAIDIKTINTFSGGSTGGLPNNDFSNHLSAWEEHIGTLLQVTLNRSGGKVRLDASVNICTPSFGAFSVGDGRGNPIAANDRAMASFYISIYRNGALIGRGSLGANIETGNINVNFNGTAVIVSAIDDISTVGNVTYTLKAGFARQEGVNIPLNVSSNSTFMITSRTLSVIEMKK
ncbi:TPA: phage tail protein [Acinetobacter baumannii]|uniref:TipJ family phage tail tip protein n=1 Tax=Acinetobacter baumannii TaxID=470 RepID=UPI0007F89113|nr:phage tail protein [Acinetobacter baumannii]ELA7050092.1 phage tail protein [Acinetobacter baumannii]OBM18120.1 phage tail protein [Acinetobacter baumannii]HAV3851400.1 phage tail protein [Acinetobacter baumannii]